MSNVKGTARRVGTAFAVAATAVAVVAVAAPAAGAVGKNVGPATILVTVPSGTQCLLVVDPALGGRTGRVTYRQGPDSGNTYQISELNVPANVSGWYFYSGTKNCDRTIKSVGPLTSPSSTPWNVTI